MSHKVHPKIYRIKKITDWNSRGFYKNHARYLEEDFRIRDFLREKLGRIGVEKIEIERFPGRINIIISSARPGLIIGRGGEGIEELKKELAKKVLRKFSNIKTIENKGKKKVKKGKEEPSLSGKISLGAKTDTEAKKEVRIEIREIKDPWTSASLTAQWIAQQIEKRVHYRRVMKQALGKIEAHKEIQGARIEVSGRLGGTEIARREWLKVGKLPRQTIRADIDYALAEARCTYGTIGVKVWIYKGERFE